MSGRGLPLRALLLPRRARDAFVRVQRGAAAPPLPHPARKTTRASRNRPIRSRGALSVIHFPNVAVMPLYVFNGSMPSTSAVSANAVASADVITCRCAVHGGHIVRIQRPPIRHLHIHRHSGPFLTIRKSCRRLYSALCVRIRTEQGHERPAGHQPLADQAYDRLLPFDISAAH